MRKQIGFDVISENIGNQEQKQILLGRVQRYLDAGWETINTHVPQSGSGALTITVVFAKYEYEEVVEASEDETATVKRGPGRHKKAEEVVPA